MTRPPFFGCLAFSEKIIPKRLLSGQLRNSYIRSTAGVSVGVWGDDRQVLQLGTEVKLWLRHHGPLHVPHAVSAKERVRSEVGTWRACGEPVSLLL